MASPDSGLLADLARQLAGEVDLMAVWKRVVHTSVAQIDGAEHAGITLLSDASVSSPVVTDSLVQSIDECQYRTGEGPCLTAAIERRPVVVVEDLGSDDRWPAFSSAVADLHLDVRSMLSFQLYTSEQTVGALNIYASTADAFTEDSVETGTLLAAHAAVAAVAANRSENLLTALETRDTIGQAKGILMERFKITPDQAFDVLISTSQQTNRKLRDIAADLVETGELRET